MVMDKIEKKLRKDVRTLKKGYIVHIEWEEQAGAKYFAAKEVLEMYLAKTKK